ncbi:MAG: DUF4412 domain-containing protein [Nibricoccus sp.]
MNTSSLFRSFGGLCLALLLSAVSASAFEGKVDMTMTSGPKDKEPQAISYRIKGEKIRMEMTAPSSGKKKKKGDDAMGAMIMDMKKKEMIMLMTEQKMYMVHPIPEPKEGKKKSSDIEFKATGRKEKIAGIEAEEWVGKSDGKINEVWVTKELGQFMTQQGGPGGKQSSAWEAFAQKGNMFPLRVIQRSKEGGPEEFHMETTAVDRSKQDDALFAPPADYEKFSMPGMGDMMKGMIPGR